MRASHFSWVFVFAIGVSIGCGEERVASPVNLEPDPAGTEQHPAPNHPEPIDPTEAAPAPRTGVVQVVDLPDEVPPLPSLSTEVEILGVDEDAWADAGRTFTVSLPGDPARTERVNTFLRARARASHEYPSQCRALFASDKVLSFSCEDTEVYERGGADVYTSFVNVDITGAEVVEYDLRSVISPTVSFDSLVRGACAGALRREGFNAEEAEEQCRGVNSSFSPRYRVSPRGVIGLTYDGDSNDVPFNIAFTDLDRAVYADTGLGQLLASVPGASVVDLELPPGVTRAGTNATGIAFGEVNPAAVLIGRWFQLPPNARTGLVIAGDSHSYRLARPGEGEGDLEAIRAALAMPGEDATWSNAVLPRLVHTRVETSFRTSPSGDRTLILPAGTILAVGLGRIDTQESAMGQRGTWALTAAAPGVSGYTAGNLLEAHEGCEPDARGFIDALPEAQRETARESVVRAMITLRRAGQEHPAIAFGAAGRSNHYQRRGVSRVEVYDAGDACALGRRLARLDLEGNLFAMRFTGTTAHGGSTLLLVGSYLDNVRLRWQLFEIGETEPMWTHEVARSVDVLTEETVDGEYFPVVVESTPPVRVTIGPDGVEVH